MVRELLAQGFSEEEIVRILVDENDFDEPRARQIIAQELGREDAGCLVELGDAETD
jgi:hypothetical protein